MNAASVTKFGCRDGAVVRALAYHQCGPGSIPRLGFICGLSWLVLYSAPRGFFAGTYLLTSNSQSGGGLCWHTDYYVSFTKSYITKFIVYRVYIIGLRYRHGCDQVRYSIYVNLKLYLYNM